MARLVDDLLLLAHADENSHALKMVDVDLDDIVYAEAERVRSLTDLRVVADVTAGRGLPAIRRPCRGWCAISSTMQSDMRATAFVSNVRPVDGQAQIIVADDGPGIPAADATQGVRSLRPTGLRRGLATPAAQASDCRSSPRSSSAHRGTVTVGESAGGGARFVVDLPLAADESVADAADRLDAVDRRTVVDLAPQISDVHLDDVVVAVVVGVPHRSNDLALADHCAAVSHEELQDAVFPWRQGQLGSRPRHPVSRRVEFEIAYGQDGGALGCAAPHQRPKPREQHDERERFDQIVVGAQVEGVGQVVLAVLGRQHQHRRPHLLRAQLPDDLVAALPRQHDVEDDRVEFV